MAESGERRVLAERKTEQAAVTSTQSEGQAGSGLLRLREAARRDASLRFNNLLHHVSVDRLEQAYLSLNRQAATSAAGKDDLKRCMDYALFMLIPGRRVAQAPDYWMIS